ncbi:hypothetical protein E1212_08110 [Jiangella ureilytica]|uniref:Uncharacterized protein n=1 Tax=Jiangella ureilytica TaxID=2530374 RepID=A0A4R4RUN4_9ACTN|nr:hypothetical protein [Jiangella ureilytica]TDC52552.1 hypothetical protein E1212_08110 [Jiangella ureilytica]
MMITDIERFRRELLTALRLRDVEPGRIGEVLAEVDSHLAETGEDPRDAFGAPADYARVVADGRPGLTEGERRTRNAGHALVGGVVGAVSAIGVMAVVRGDETALGLPAWLTLTLGVVAALVGIVLLAVRARIVRDPRTGHPIDWSQRWFVPVVLAGYAALLGVCAGIAALL